jgi:hypothetical protein
MKENLKIKPKEDWVHPERTDETGKCFKLEDSGGIHYYRQDRNRVLHVNISSGVLINELPVNHIESGRQNWGEEFEVIGEEEFKNVFQNTVIKLYE